MFIDFLIKQKNSVWIAHNGGRFDTLFLLKYLLVEKKIIPESVMNGNQALSVEIPEIKLQIMDSFCFLNMALSKFPKALGIEGLQKGYHPYKFTDLNYAGEMIAMSYFDLPNNEEAMKKFKKWYDEKCQHEYIFRNEIYYYCRVDVDILRRGCIIFSKLIEEQTGIVPFYDKSCVTIASLALKIFRTNFLNKGVIGQIPPNGYRRNVNQSVIAVSWLYEIENELNEQGYELDSIMSEFGEKCILGRYVDG